ncbi:DUF943 family protein [Chimaeribacter arupi]|uniref:DUF943 domain-containing protein n=1 Tax=Chimaeribacter arupi TaxID=2060066 RepID=A0A2N5EHH5_9GAMM|nr:DUF943 family protein [Chimaeribacter arupi]PLR43335.1 hypothetical protein CYR34_20840 [Chimaeribacter arupi]
MLKNKNLLILFIMGLLFALWLLQPAKIIAVHRSGTFTDIIVENFPVTDKGKIRWWQANKELIEEKYKFLPADKNENYTVIIWGWRGSYKEMPDTDQGSDLLCFEDMKTKKNCIDKDKRKLWISKYGKGKYEYSVGLDDRTYTQLTENAEPKRAPD